MQQPPRGGTWVGSTCDISIFKSKLYNASTIERMAACFGVFPKCFLFISNIKVKYYILYCTYDSHHIYTFQNARLASTIFFQLKI
ncbi:hypothetical protein V1478_004979 [Vespula squamosa]|uniref:Uncharacterized protein n=1 Tax=Vespula squamosa TaxID=30214 RepID=A0ABD2BFB7_VESSQ